MKRFIESAGTCEGRVSRPRTRRVMDDYVIGVAKGFMGVVRDLTAFSSIDTEPFTIFDSTEDSFLRFEDPKSWSFFNDRNTLFLTEDEKTMFDSGYNDLDVSDQACVRASLSFFVKAYCLLQPLFDEAGHVDESVLTIPGLNREDFDTLKDVFERYFRTQKSLISVFSMEILDKLHNSRDQFSDYINRVKTSFFKEYYDAFSELFYSWILKSGSDELVKDFQSHFMHYKAARVSSRHFVQHNHVLSHQNRVLRSQLDQARRLIDESRES